MTGGISAILLAAGESRRMGQPKLILPWGDTTVLGQVVETFAQCRDRRYSRGNWWGAPAGRTIGKTTGCKVSRTSHP